MVPLRKFLLIFPLTCLVYGCVLKQTNRGSKVRAELGLYVPNSITLSRETSVGSFDTCSELSQAPPKIDSVLEQEGITPSDLPSSTPERPKEFYGRIKRTSTYTEFVSELSR